MRLTLQSKMAVVGAAIFACPLPAQALTQETVVSIIGIMTVAGKYCSEYSVDVTELTKLGIAGQVDLKVPAMKEAVENARANAFQWVRRDMARFCRCLL